jgi:hypothetical protein
VCEFQLVPSQWRMTNHPCILAPWPQAGAACGGTPPEWPSLPAPAEVFSCGLVEPMLKAPLGQLGSEANGLCHRECKDIWCWKRVPAILKSAKCLNNHFQSRDLFPAPQAQAPYQLSFTLLLATLQLLLSSCPLPSVSLVLCSSLLHLLLPHPLLLQMGLSSKGASLAA